VAESQEVSINSGGRMGIYSEYLDAKLDAQALTAERKKQLDRISKVAHRPRARVSPRLVHVVA